MAGKASRKAGKQAARKAASSRQPVVPAESKAVKAGRPTSYTVELVESLLDWMVRGGSVGSWCAQPGNPDRTTVVRWLADPERADFARAFTRAREAQADAIFDQCLDIADDSSKDWIETKTGRRVDQEAIGRSRVRIDTRLRIAASLNPKKYSEKIDLRHSGSISTGELTMGDIERQIGLMVERARARMQPEAIPGAAPIEPIALARPTNGTGGSS